MTTPSREPEPRRDQRATTALLALMLAVSGLTASVLGDAASRAHGAREYRMVDLGLGACQTEVGARVRGWQDDREVGESPRPTMPSGRAHLAGTRLELERRRGDLPPPVRA
ncbi:MAG: hypothetical protein VXY94_00315 [Planctomycetota bacterium]|nr:hypothetical protein [Planctomycetota bacterium]MED6308111.1 hypothetical protein [Planctomycetota bacterium]